MRAPDRRAGGDRGQEEPAKPLGPFGHTGALEEAHDRPGAGNAYQGRQQDQPDIVLAANAFDYAKHVVVTRCNDG